MNSSTILIIHVLKLFKHAHVCRMPGEDPSYIFIKKKKQFQQLHVSLVSFQKWFRAYSA